MMKVILKAYKYRMHPNKEQQQMLAKYFGSVRFVYNHFLAERKQQYEKNGKSDNYYAQANTLTKLKKTRRLFVTKGNKFTNAMEGDYLRQLVAWRDYVTIGVTLTGHDELEPGAPTNRERIILLNHLLHCHICIFVSLEPVIDFESSLKMILDTLNVTAEYRIGLMSPYKKDWYDHWQCERFFRKVTELSQRYGFTVKWKESIRKFYEDGLPLLKLMK